MARPETSHLSEAVQGYIALVPENDIFQALDNNRKEVKELLGAIHSSKLGYAYAPGKWTVAQVLQHCLDAERIYAYRALRIARGDQTPLPGFDEKAYGAMAPANHRTLMDLSEEVFAVRRASAQLLMSFTEDCWARQGVANDRPIDVLSLAFLMVGHMRHHIRILKERYAV